MAKTLNIKRATAIKFAVAMGFKTADKWDDKKLAAKLKEFPKITDTSKIKSDKAKKMLASIKKAGKVVITSEKAAPKAKAKQSQPKAAAKKSTKKAAKKETPKKKAPKEKTEKFSRYAVAIDIIKKEKKGTTEGLIKKTDKASDKPNENATTFVVTKVLHVLELIGYVKVTSDGKWKKS